MKKGIYSHTYIILAILVLLLFTLTFIHPGPFIIAFRIPAPRDLLEAILGIICLMAIVPVAKSDLGKGTKIAFISVLVSIVLYFFLRFIHIPGKVLWLFLVLSLVIIVWSTISVVVNKGK